jgi:RNA polymerase sigma-70 factor (ECF subfamily)
MSVFENNRALLDGFRAGVRDALTRVYFHYVDQVAMLARCGFVIEAQGSKRVPGVGSGDLERDIVQETFARAFSKAGREAYDGVRPYRPYLLRITKNLLIDRARRTRPELSLDPSVPEQLLDAAMIAEPTVAEDIDWKNLSRATREYMERVSEELREVVRLRFEEELSQEETAARMGITRRRVRALEDRVEKGLMKHLKKLKLVDSSSNLDGSA